VSHPRAVYPPEIADHYRQHGGKATCAAYGTSWVTLRRLGLRATEAQGDNPGKITEWADLMQGRGGCKSASEALEGIAWIVKEGKRAGIAIAYAKDAGADRWADNRDYVGKQLAESEGHLIAARAEAAQWKDRAVKAEEKLSETIENIAYKDIAAQRDAAKAKLGEAIKALELIATPYPHDTRAIAVAALAKYGSCQEPTTSIMKDHHERNRYPC